MPVSAGSQGKEGDFDVVGKMGVYPVNELNW